MEDVLEIQSGYLTLVKLKNGEYGLVGFWQDWPEEARNAWRTVASRGLDPNTFLKTWVEDHGDEQELVIEYEQLMIAAAIN